MGQHSTLSCSTDSYSHLARTVLLPTQSQPAALIYAYVSSRTHPAIKSSIYIGDDSECLENPMPVPECAFVGLFCEKMYTIC